MGRLWLSHGSFLVQYKHFLRMEANALFTVLRDTHISAAASSIAQPLRTVRSKASRSRSVKNGYAAILAFSSSEYSCFKRHLLVHYGFTTQSGITPFICAPPRREGLTCNQLATNLQPTCYLIIKYRSAQPKYPGLPLHPPESLRQSGTDEHWNPSDRQRPRSQDRIRPSFQEESARTLPPCC